MRFLSAIIAALVIPSALTSGINPHTQVTEDLLKQMENIVQGLWQAPGDKPTPDMVARMLSGIPLDTLLKFSKLVSFNVQEVNGRGASQVPTISPLIRQRHVVK